MNAKIVLYSILISMGICRCFANVAPSRTGIAFGNALPRVEDLRGETVYAVLGETETRVEAVYDISDFSPSSRSVVLPVFARAEEKPEDVVRAAQVRASFGSKSLTEISLGQAPGGTPPVSAELQIVWVRIGIHDFQGSGSAGRPSVLRVAYTQPHIDQTFYYLPQSIPIGSNDKSAHNWGYPLIARAPNRRFAVTAGDSTWEQLGDAVVVYLKCDQLVAVKTR